MRVYNSLNRRILIIFGAVVVIGLGVIGVKRLNAPKYVMYQDDVLSVSFKLHEDLGQTYDGDGDKSDGIVARFEQTAESSTNMLVTLKFEKDFAKISAATKQDPIKIIKDNIDKLYPSRFPGFTILSANDISSNMHKITFQYDSQTGEKITQTLLIAMKDSDTAIYLSAQSKSSDYERIDKIIFEPLFSSFKI